MFQKHSRSCFEISKNSKNQIRSEFFKNEKHQGNYSKLFHHDKKYFSFLFIRLPEPFHFKSFRSPMAPPAKPILEGLHEDFLRFCEHHGLAAGYYLTNQIMDMFQGRLKNWDQIVGTVSTLFYLKIFFMGEIS